MKKLNKLMAECITRNLNCSVTYQRINSYSIEIYTGYKETYKEIYFSDGHKSSKKAIKNALLYLGN